MSMIYDSYFGFDNLCNEIINIDNSINLVAVLNNKGRVIETKVREAIDTYYNPLKKEMFFMQCVLQTSMNKDHDDELGKITSYILEREKFTMFSFEFLSYVILVVSRSKNNTIQLKEVIIEKINKHKKIEIV
ncbi:hypothetical protein NSIN_80062 [Nitrosotalea sinensis]|uniref:Roadblock/LAMTOR2 domain-containing protein n=2 Tax=Nitrosotalea sinensis TaxID=1499975 RepID=A0A2H1EJ08_9ARCH|nr:hypothetical protein NSIN_80062 [Candidatus Nitrosotalea sinensis]